MAPLILSTAPLTFGPITADAGADPGGPVEQAVATARAASACEPLRHDPTLDQAADIVNRSTVDYYQHRTADVPADDPQPTALLQDLGIESGKSLSLMGAAPSAADAIKGALLQGYRAIPDCGYTDIGTSLIAEEGSAYVMVVAVLVGQ